MTKTRVEAFSDGVFAIVLTLLAFQFKVPKFSSHVDLTHNFNEFLKIAPYLMGFVFSFFMIRQYLDM